MRFVLLRAKQTVEKFAKRTTITYGCFAPRSKLLYTAEAVYSSPKLTVITKEKNYHEQSY